MVQWQGSSVGLMWKNLEDGELWQKCKGNGGSGGENQQAGEEKEKIGTCEWLWKWWQAGAVISVRPLSPSLCPATCVLSQRAEGAGPIGKPVCQLGSASAQRKRRLFPICLPRGSTIWNLSIWSGFLSVAQRPSMQWQWPSLRVQSFMNWLLQLTLSSSPLPQISLFYSTLSYLTYMSLRAILPSLGKNW